MAAIMASIKGQRREIGTKGKLNRLKKEGYVPGIVYGKTKEALPIAVNSRHINKIFSTYGFRGLFNLEIEGEEKPVTVLLREMQTHPVTKEMIHLDFFAIDMNEEITSEVPIVIAGEEEILKKGGILQLGVKEVEVECLPKDLPEAIICDISALDIGDHMTVGDLKAPAGVKIISDPDSIVVTILAPKVSEEETSPAEETESEA
ncbi:LSU ribosomal protein L25P [Thermosyntropha lipolytica DSM 11003]|uniref:Large ribosomal subunit protein bL25 n=1 Tax=Thermosyntropha lipolytica DSM 11003 TaxID=1123382 RepID=A0A1M5JS13_9FIRM|nr:50S ribosomal protein L25 [Thermosyntropha lipolytica]SHG43080.1 LSU ribosomal protein L25P [Thermosyntropha lipolytica DSM 11003]